MHIQEGGTWGDLQASLLEHKTVVLRAIDDNMMMESILKNLKRRLPETLSDNLIVMRAPQYDKQIEYAKRSGFLITLKINNQQAKSFLLKEEA